jgi:hypothetical protein
MELFTEHLAYYVTQGGAVVEDMLARGELRSGSPPKVLTISR